MVIGPVDVGHGEIKHLSYGTNVLMFFEIKNLLF